MLSESSLFHKLGVPSTRTAWPPEGGSHLGPSTLPSHICLAIPSGLCTEGSPWSLSSSLAISLIWRRSQVRHDSHACSHFRGGCLIRVRWCFFMIRSRDYLGQTITAVVLCLHHIYQVREDFCSSRFWLGHRGHVKKVPMARLRDCSEVRVHWEIIQGPHSLPDFHSLMTFRAQSHFIAADN